MRKFIFKAVFRVVLVIDIRPQQLKGEGRGCIASFRTWSLTGQLLSDKSLHHRDEDKALRVGETAISAIYIASRLFSVL